MWVEVVETIEQLELMVKELEAFEGPVGFDLEATSERPEDALLVGMSFAVGEDGGWYVPVGHDEGCQLPLQVVLDAVAATLAAGVIVHGGKYDSRVMAKYGLPVSITLDSMSAVRLLGEVDFGVGLKETVQRWYGEEATTWSDLTEHKKLRANQVSIEDMAPYAVADAVNTYRIGWDALSKMTLYVRSHLLNYEVDAMRIAALMESTGLPVDMAFVETQLAAGKAMMAQLDADANQALSDLVATKGHELAAAMKERFGKLWKGSVNLRSAPQLQYVLFELAELEPVKHSKKTKKPSASKDVIDKLAKTNPAVAAVAAYRSAATTVGRLEELQRYARSREGWHYVHSSLNPTGAATGRWTSSSPNAQNHPRTPYSFTSSQGEWSFKLRDAIAAPPGFVIVSSDYSQIELRVAAGMSKEPTWLNAFEQGTDVHRATAAAVFSKHPEAVTDDERHIGKTLNFSMLFGAQEGKIAETLSISRQEARRIINRFWQGLKEVNRWVGGIHSSTAKRGYVETAFGRKRYLPDVFDGRDWVKQKALRESVNTVIQGTAADMLKIGLSRQQPIADSFGAKPFLVVHDQFVWLVPDYVDLRQFAHAMEPVICVQVAGFPTTLADWGVGRRLGSLQKYDSAGRIPAGLEV